MLWWLQLITFYHTQQRAEALIRNSCHSQGAFRGRTASARPPEVHVLAATVRGKGTGDNRSADPGDTRPEPPRRQAGVSASRGPHAPLPASDPVSRPNNQHPGRTGLDRRAAAGRWGGDCKSRPGEAHRTSSPRGEKRVRWSLQSRERCKPNRAQGLGLIWSLIQTDTRQGKEKMHKLVREIQTPSRGLMIARNCY